MKIFSINIIFFMRAALALFETYAMDDKTYLERCATPSITKKGEMK